MAFIFMKSHIASAATAAAAPHQKIKTQQQIDEQKFYQMISCVEMTCVVGTGRYLLFALFTYLFLCSLRLNFLTHY